MAQIMSDQELNLLQKLSSNEKQVRFEALKQLRKYFVIKSKKSGFTERHLREFWKGLFYCLYMTDKLLPQEEVAEKISCLIHDFCNFEDAVLFAKSGFLTLCNEWDIIDVYRIHKYLLLVRRLFRQLLVLLSNKEWCSADVDVAVSMLSTSVICPKDDTQAVPLGFKLHFCDIYLEELSKICCGILTHDIIIKFVLPFIEVLAYSKIEIYCRKVTKVIFHYLMMQSDVGLHSEFGYSNSQDSDGEEEDSSSDNEEVEHILDPRAGGVNAVIPPLNLDYSALSRQLHLFGSKKNVKSINRKLLYKISRQMQDLSEGVYPFAVAKKNRGRALSKHEIDSSVKRLLNDNDESEATPCISDVTPRVHRFHRKRKLLHKKKSKDVLNSKRKKQKRK